jgi:chromosome partitioning protein
MTFSITLFNNKGGVGKTTFLYHLAHILADKGVKTLMVDCDSQCNLTAYALTESAIERSWSERGNSIYRAIEPVARTIGDIRDRAPSKLRDSLWVIPGDLLLSDFEDLLGNTWNAARGGSEAALRPQVAIYRYMRATAAKINADIVLIDLGPNLGALNRAVLGGSDYILVPIAPDLFSLRGTENLGSKLVAWRREWDQCNGAWTGVDLETPRGTPKFLGYITQHHNMRNTAAGMTHGWQIFGTRVADAVRSNIVDKLAPLGQVADESRQDFDLGSVPNLHSLIPYSMEARKPIFDCDSADGLRGAHIASARDSRKYFEPIADLIVDSILTD